MKFSRRFLPPLEPYTEPQNPHVIIVYLVLQFHYFLLTVNTEILLCFLFILYDLSTFIPWLSNIIILDVIPKN